MLAIPFEHALIFASALFGIGLFGLIVQRSLLRILLAVEAMFNGAAFGFVACAVHFGQTDGHIMFLLILAVAASEVCVALAIVLHYDRLFHSLDIASGPNFKEW